MLAVSESLTLRYRAAAAVTAGSPPILGRFQAGWAPQYSNAL